MRAPLIDADEVATEVHLSPQNPALLIQLTLSAFSHMLIYTAVFEFICSQSPHSMKGLLIGVLYVIRGLYQTCVTLCLSSNSCTSSAVSLNLVLHEHSYWSGCSAGVHVCC